MNVRTLALGLAVNRVLFGAGFVLNPARTARSWIGPVAASAGGAVMVRAAGARDVALGVGALAALRGHGDPRAWFAAHLVSDLTDVAATWSGRQALGPGRTAYAMTVGGASTAIAVLYLLDRPPSPAAPG